jgi:hypothetical protein
MDRRRLFFFFRKVRRRAAAASRMRVQVLVEGRCRAALVDELVDPELELPLPR